MATCLLTTVRCGNSTMDEIRACRMTERVLRPLRQIETGRKHQIRHRPSPPAPVMLPAWMPTISPIATCSSRPNPVLEAEIERLMRQGAPQAEVLAATPGASLTPKAETIIHRISARALVPAFMNWPQANIQSVTMTVTIREYGEEPAD